MNLTTKVTLLLVGVISATFVANFLVLNTTVMSSFVQLENDTATQNADRVRQAIEREAGFLGTLATDWALWTDTRNFVRGEPSDYAANNLIDTALVGLNVNTLVLTNLAGRVIWGMSLDLEIEEEIEIAEMPLDQSWKSHPLFQEPDAGEDNVFTGAILTDKGVMLVASAPILDSEGEGPSAGTLVFGKLLSESVVEILVEQTGVAFALIDPGEQRLPDAANNADKPFVVESSRRSLNSFQILRDTDGEPISVIKTQTPRDITRSGTRTLLAALGLLVLAGIAFLIAVALGLRVIALSPLSHLTKTVVNIARTGNLKNRSDMKRSDEIGVLSSQFDEMLGKLDRVNNELATSEARANHLAHHDLVTNLPNRLAMLEHIDKILQLNQDEGSSGAILFADLDRFKRINDTFGHGAGDDLLRQAAARIKQVAEPTTHVSRLGGDEFALICENADQAEALSEKLIDCFDEPFSIMGNTVKVSVSLGIAAIDSNNVDAAELLRRADIALYSSKEEGRGQFRVFREDMDNRVLIKHDLIHNLMLALDNGDFFLNYQPIVTSDGSKISGLEVLIRWRHADRGDILPEVFIPLAEDTGLIHRLGAWVLKAAMTDAARWPGVTLAINLSPIQFFHHGFVEQVLAIAAETKVDPSHIELEITENVLIGEIEQVVAKLSQLKKAGFKLVLDDFGTGYASLNYLRRFPFDKLKIDRSFTAGLGEAVVDMQIIQSIVNLARALDLSVTAEGVETAEQHSLLKTTGCSQMQGFWFYKPMSLEETDRLMSDPQTLIQSASE
jgi:diguanylate cyclase (GGDEF)-like protein